jgi:hypothetical protein
VSMVVPRLAGRCIHEVPVEQHNSLACQWYIAPVTVFLWKKNGPITPALVNPHQFQFQAILFMLPHMTRILRSPNVTIMMVNFTRDVKSSLINEAHLAEIVTVMGYPRQNVGSTVMALW